MPPSFCFDAPASSIQSGCPNNTAIEFLELFIVISQPRHSALPSTAELPCSDDTPVDNEDQNLLPNLLLFLLLDLWSERLD